MKIRPFFMPKIHDTRLAAWRPGRLEKKWRNHWSLKSEFGEFERRAPRSFKAWPVDNFVDKYGVWEFGSLTKRTYRYDYHASSIGWDITR